MVGCWFFVFTKNGKLVPLTVLWLLLSDKLVIPQGTNLHKNIGHDNGDSLKMD